MDANLSGMVVMITGASGGIGSAIARGFASEGARLALHYRSDRANAERLQREIGAECLLVQADLGNEAQARRAFASALKHFGRIDTLIANAGSWDDGSSGSAGSDWT